MRVKLHFTLVGKSKAWARNLPKGANVEVTNEDTLSYVRDTVADQFGDRALVIVNEHRLQDNSRTYPEYYAAGWFVSEDGERSELVIVDHGSTMEAATNAMMESVKVTDWPSLSAKI